VTCSSQEKREGGKSARERKVERKREEMHLLDEAVSVEGMLTREDIELPRQQLHPTTPTLLIRINDDEPLVQLLDISLDRVCSPRCVAHVSLEAFDVRGVGFEGVADLVFEGVDDYEVGEEGEDVFDFEERGRVEEAHGTV
jgi:hypothetical protein